MICIPVFEPTTRGAIAAMKQAAALADVIELRLDAMAEHDLKALLKARPRPVIVTARTVEDGGRRVWKERERLDLLFQAARLGAEMIDIELRTGAEVIRELAAAKKRSALIVSWHTFADTPSRAVLRARVKECYEAGADICKLVTTAHDALDNGRLLEVVATTALRERRRMIGFCMGEAGRLSRIATLCMGGMLTYCHLGRPLAPGMMSAEETIRHLVAFGLRDEVPRAAVERVGAKPS